jgi:hypothetical protein
MGASGYGPFDSDPGDELVYDLAKHVRDVTALPETPTEADEYEKWRKSTSAHARYALARAAIQLLMTSRGDTVVGAPWFADCVNALVRIRNDIRWLAGWKDPKAIVASLHYEAIEVLSAVPLDQCNQALRHAVRNAVLKASMSDVPPPSKP